MLTNRWWQGAKLAGKDPQDSLATHVKSLLPALLQPSLKHLICPRQFSHFPCWVTLLLELYPQLFPFLIAQWQVGSDEVDQ